MLTKIIQPSFYSRGVPTAHLVGAFSKGLDGDMLHKVASAGLIQHMSKDIRPEKGYGFVHLITTGAGEVYGPNNNADFFNKEARMVEYPNPKPGAKKTEVLAGGLIEYHKTFPKYAAVYREHYNSRKGAKPLGEVLIEAYNPEMDRGELIVKLAEDKWGNELQKLASGKHVFWSMGAGVPYDTCSECGNRAYKTSEYCTHAVYDKLKLTKEGNQIFLYNDQPHFHDISKVIQPADKIAFGLAKVAKCGGNTIDMFENHEGVYIPHSLIDKLAGQEVGKRWRILEKLAEIEKKVLAVASPNTQDAALSEAFDGEELDPGTCSKLAQHDHEDVIEEANNAKVMLPPEGFIRIVMKKPTGDIEGLDGIREALPGVFSELLEEGTSAVEDGSYTPKDVNQWSGLKEIVESLKDSHSLEDEPVRVRIIKSTIKGPSVQKQANQLLKSTRKPTEQNKLLAKEYAKYQIGFVAAHEKCAKLVVLHNTQS
jgi:hypothetical protein